MSVYIDPLRKCSINKEWHWKESCHMFADTLEELHAFAQKIGMKRDWFQNKRLPHYDLTKTRRKIAIENGAVEVDLNWVKQKLKQTKKMNLNDLMQIKESLKKECPDFDDVEYQKFFNWIENSADGNLIWSDTFVNARGQRTVNEKFAHWSFSWRFGFVSFLFKKDEEIRAKIAASMFVWLWLKHNVPVEYAIRCAEAYALNYAVPCEK